MAGVGTTIVANDYNAIQIAIASVLGQVTGGYGTALQSGQVLSTAKITSAQWNDLQTDISNVNYHQLNTAPSYNGSPLTTASNGGSVAYKGNPNTPPATKIRDADRAAYLAVANALANSSSSTVGGVTYPGKFAQAPAGQFTTPTSGTFPVNSQRAAGWNGYVLNTVTLTFPSNQAAEYFFNAGSVFAITAKAEVGQTAVVGTKDYSWKTMLDNMGTITMGYRATTNSGASGAGSGYGWTWFNANRGAAPVTIYKNTITGTYAPNEYDVNCSLNSSGNVFTFQIYFQDLSPNPNTTTWQGNPLVNPGTTYGPYGVDENITAVITSTINALYSSGGVSVAAYLPTVSATFP